MNNSIIEQIKQIQTEIPPDVCLIAVSKKVSAEKIRIAYEAGIRDFGENRLQEMLEKQRQLEDLTDISWHFIGHLQSNKAKKAVECCPWIHSVDNLKLARRLDKYAEEALNCQMIKLPPQICLQVKVLPDENKYGWDIEQLWQDLDSLNQLKFLQVRGLMTILPLGLSPQQTLSAFNNVKQLVTEIHSKYKFSQEFNQLSMGMSGDYSLAVEAGATMIRLGTIIFGARKLGNG